MCMCVYVSVCINFASGFDAKNKDTYNHIHTHTYTNKQIKPVCLCMCMYLDYIHTIHTPYNQIKHLKKNQLVFGMYVYVYVSICMYCMYEVCICMYCEQLCAGLLVFLSSVLFL
jgi:hypothetical protein